MSQEGAVGEPRCVKLALLADPDLPQEIAQRLAAELPNLLRRFVAADVTWDVTTFVTAVVGDEQVDVAELVQVTDRVAPSDDWRLVIVLTDLPRRDGTRPVAAEVSVDDRVGMVSLPALGSIRLYRRARETIIAVARVLVGTADRLVAQEQAARERAVLPRRRGARIRIEPDERGGIRYVTRGFGGRLRLLAGMVRANRPWRLFTGLSRALAGVFAAAVLAVVNDVVWDLATALGSLRLILLTIISLAALVAWLIIDHGLWEHGHARSARERAVLYNASTVATLFIGVLCLYVVLYVVLGCTVAFLLPQDVVAEAIGREPSWGDYAALTWFTTSLAMLGGALGAGLEDEAAVRRAAYGQRQRERQLDGSRENS
ncbi:hypothetical protein [Micromonospora sp. U21]|uniref:hypothetical protein n=1 Tax=Micromonospora sp. U21 TaxID=2824899 RepID=UPI001B37B2F7|nr:hypothetical protein [Micromonospora sp. U21]MBQ0902077.1 hypothetical protein [Micromonospora sp. U21]